MYYKNLTRGRHFGARTFGQFLRCYEERTSGGVRMNSDRPLRVTVAALGMIVWCGKPGVARGQERAASFDTVAVETALRDELRRTRTPGASIAIVMDGRVIYTKAIGVSDVETGQAMTPETLVRIGSITKSFTGLTALLLADRGIIDLDRPIGRVRGGTFAGPRVADVATPAQPHGRSGR